MNEERLGHTRKNTHGVRHRTDVGVIRSDRGIGGTLSRNVPSSRTGLLWYINRLLGGQKMMRHLTSHRLRQWAYNNALLLIVMSSMFVLTWLTTTISFYVWVWSK